MRTTPGLTRRLPALLIAGVAVAACGTHPTGPPAVTPPAVASGATTTSATPMPSPTPGPVPAPPVVSSTVGDTEQPQQLSTAEYKMWAAQLYTGELTLIHQEQQTLADETAPAPTRVKQITDQLLPQLRQTLVQAQSVQPVDAPAADLHRNLINALHLLVAAYQDLATGLAQDDAAALARGRSELTDEGQELGIWVRGVPELAS